MLGVSHQNLLVWVGSDVGLVLDVVLSENSVPTVGVIDHVLKLLMGNLDTIKRDNLLKA